MHPFLDLPPSLGDAILSLNPTAYWPLDDGHGPLRSLAQNWPATVTGSPTYGVAAQSPIGRGVTVASSPSALTAVSFPAASSAISMCAMVNLAYNAGNRTILDRFTTGQGSWVWDIANGLNRFITKTSAGATADAYSPSTVVGDSTWHFVYASFRASDKLFTLCTDGTISTSTGTGTWDPSQASIGVNIWASNTASLTARMNGTTAHVALWNDLYLSQAAVSWLSSIARGG